jgi:hypothetical protein
MLPPNVGHIRQAAVRACRCKAEAMYRLTFSGIQRRVALKQEILGSVLLPFSGFNTTHMRKINTLFEQSVKF